MIFRNFTLWQPKYFESEEFQRWWRQFQRQWLRTVREYHLDSTTFIYSAIGTMTAITVGVISLFVYQEWSIRRSLRDINWRIDAGHQQHVGQNTKSAKEKTKKSAIKNSSVDSNTTARQRRKNKNKPGIQVEEEIDGDKNKFQPSSHHGTSFSSPQDNAKLMESLRMFCPYISGEGGEKEQQALSPTNSMQEVRRSSMFEELVEDEMAEQDEDGKVGITLFDDVDKPVDPVEMSMHLPGEVKRIRTKLQTREIEKDLNDQQMRDERDKMQHVSRVVEKEMRAALDPASDRF